MFFADADGEVLVPGDFPIGGGGFVEEDGADEEGVGERGLEEGLNFEGVDELVDFGEVEVEAVAGGVCVLTDVRLKAVGKLRESG